MTIYIAPACLICLDALLNLVNLPGRGVMTIWTRNSDLMGNDCSPLHNNSHKANKDVI